MLPRNQGEDGFALVSTLWVLALIAAVAASIMMSERVRVQATVTVIEAAKARELADGLAARTRLRLAGDAGTVGAPDAPPVLCALPGGGIGAVAVALEAGKVDLNGAPHRLVVALLSGVGADPAQAETMARGIEAFRQPRPDLEDEAPRSANASGRTIDAPKRAPFDSIYELDQVEGMTEPVLSRLLPLTTVETHAPGLDPQVASLDVLHAVTGAPESGGRTSLLASFLLPFTAVAAVRVVTIHAEALTPAGGLASSEIVVAYGGRDAAGVLHEVRRGRSRFDADLRAAASTHRSLSPC